MKNNWVWKNKRNEKKDKNKRKRMLKYRMGVEKIKIKKMVQLGSEGREEIEGERIREGSLEI